jgi:hypothetical protein
MRFHSTPTSESDPLANHKLGELNEQIPSGGDQFTSIIGVYRSCMWRSQWQFNNFHWKAAGQLPRQTQMRAHQ